MSTEFGGLGGVTSRAGREGRGGFIAFGALFVGRSGDGGGDVVSVEYFLVN